MRHRCKDSKLGMKQGQRKSLMWNLTKTLIMDGKVDTTLERAKAGSSYAERVITLACRGDQHSRRTVFSRLQDKKAVNTLYEEVAPRYEDRNGGYTRVVKLGPRKGDGAERARLMLV